MQKNRPRRLRLNAMLRDLVEENRVTANDLIYPLFIKEGETTKEAIKSMPGIYRWGLESILTEIQSATELGIKAIALFPVIDQSLKTESAQEAINPNGLTQRAIKTIKTKFPDLLVISDIALDPYTNHGHDGLIQNGKVINDATVKQLAAMAVVQAEAGADIVAPSDMMDGRVGAIRHALDEAGFQDTLIMSYTAKYASCLYSPFRDALGSLGSQDQVQHQGPQDKKTYQMNPANSLEAIKELELDIMEGADIVMVKPASWYLDIVKNFKEQSHVPVAAYQVSGEYAMIHAAATAGYIDLDQAMKESLTSIKRAGADLILTYFAKDFLTRQTRLKTINHSHSRKI
ncbi:MAG: porphobilinogen synthase [Cyanobacteria bacterium]|nr:porphobilinogen synthase [Cyanobacteriota bacterium]